MQEPSLMIAGPVYLHWDGSYETYHAFFAHLQCKLDNINISGLEYGVGDLIAGSEEDRVLTKPVDTCFPQATTLLCCRHLQENVRRRLQDKVGVPAEVWQDIVRRVFDAERLAGGHFPATLDASGHFPDASRYFLVWSTGTTSPTSSQCVGGWQPP